MAIYATLVIYNVKKSLFISLKDDASYTVGDVGGEDRDESIIFRSLREIAVPLGSPAQSTGREFNHANIPAEPGGTRRI